MLEYTPDEAMGLHRAFAFAATAHGAQRRKGSDVPYIVHPCEVAQILTANGCGAAVVTAGLLHDTLEDTAATPAQILAEFGPEVLRLVQACSEDKSLRWEARKQHTIDSLQGEADEAVRQLACADKVSNLRSMKADLAQRGEGLWSCFKRGREQQAWYYRRITAALAGLDLPMYREMQALCAELFGAGA